MSQWSMNTSRQTVKNELREMNSIVTVRHGRPQPRPTIPICSQTSLEQDDDFRAMLVGWLLAITVNKTFGKAKVPSSSNTGGALKRYDTPLPKVATSFICFYLVAIQ